MAFLTKLIALLTPRKLAARFNVIPFLTVLDPEPEVKNAVSPSLLQLYVNIHVRCRPSDMYPTSFETCLPASLPFLIYNSSS